MKIQEGLSEGAVLFHEYGIPLLIIIITLKVEKSSQEIERLKQIHEEKKKLKEKRRLEQENHIKKKMNFEQEDNEGNIQKIGVL
jgi:ribosome biogenesis protein SSF1/2